MFTITFKILSNNIDKIVEILEINEIYNFYYEAPLNITTDNWGYGYEEKEDSIIDLNISFDGNQTELNEFTKILSNLLNINEYTTKEIAYEYEEFILPEIQINETWSILHPTLETLIPNRINFDAQGAFGTGLHETTKDILNFILKNDFSNKDILDIGTGSGILAIATAIKNANKVVAIDIRDVVREVNLNASLNNLNNINAYAIDLLKNDILKDQTFDWIYINIGGEETNLFMPYINSHIKNSGYLLVSGLVEWSMQSVIDNVIGYGYKKLETIQTNEWCTIILNKCNNN
ncbi:MAG: 50S ribosomal protein L11 methyltransferase [Sarcina sp.]